MPKVTLPKVTSAAAYSRARGRHASLAGMPMSDQLGQRSARHRAQMVKALAGSGSVTDRDVLDAMYRVRREEFVPRFWAPGLPDEEGSAERMLEWRVDQDEDGTALDVVYDIDLAIAVRPPTRRHAGGAGVVTSTASAPRVVGWMLELLELRPGMTVLEIGLGSGYNAALLRELVGPDGRVTSVDIDAELVSATHATLEAAGYGDVRTLAADGYYGVPQLAPFDRVVATVGCTDIAPAWLDELAPGGFCLLPLQHGSWHPLTRAARTGDRVTGRCVGGTGFVPIQGRQASGRAWPPRGRGPDPVMEWSSLPAPLAGELEPRPGEGRSEVQQMWDLAFLLALEDRRATFLRLVDGGSVAGIEPAASRVGWAGAKGELLRDRLVDVAEEWSALGRPSMRDYLSTFTPLAGAPPAVDGPGPAVGTALPQRPSRWVINRFDFRQTVELRPR